MRWTIDKLGGKTYPSPLHLSSVTGDLIANFVEDDARVLVDHNLKYIEKCWNERCIPDSFELAGPRKNLYFNPESPPKAAIVTCGGLCPGLNDVIRGLVMQLYYHYQVKEIMGIKFGYRGMTLSECGNATPLTPDIVDKIHTFGGSFLGSSRGPQSSVEMVDYLQRRGIQILFAIGGDGTIRGAMDIYEECRNRDYKVAVIGIPKTIDNDIACIDRSFGFSTAVEKATEVLNCAHVEARGAFNGVGLVKLMGRHSGFIAARSTLASGFVNFVLVPEIPFSMNGENGFLAALENRINRRRHAVIAVAEGAGQDHLRQLDGREDPSGNKRLGDIGLFLKEQIKDHFASKNIPLTLKYFDPSYIIRSTPANTEDSVYCSELAQNAVHAAMEGGTNAIIGSRHEEFVMIPMELAVSRRKQIDVDGPEWLAVIQSTGQPAVMNNNRNLGLNQTKG